jgi:hypothetical protein
MSRKTGPSHGLVFVLEVLQLDSFFLHFGEMAILFFSTIPSCLSLSLPISPKWILFMASFS